MRSPLCALAPVLLAAACAAPAVPDPTATAPAASSSWPSARTAAAPTATAPRPLRVLLTDDDGWDAAGITAMHTALRDAGYDVTLVAPDGNRSGAGASADGRTDLDEHAPGIYAVEGQPVDAVRAGLELLRADPPDVVVSGTNLGHNSGTGVVESGTVGAAATAARAGVPAIAASTHRGSSQADCRATADYVVRLLRALGPALFVPGVVLNVNYPTARADEVRVRDPLVLELDGEDMRVPTDGPSDEVDLLDDGVATLTELDVDGGAHGEVARRLADVPA